MTRSELLLGITIGLLIGSASLDAANITSPPPLKTLPVELSIYLQRLYDNLHTVGHTTTSPNGSRQGSPGDMIWGTFGGNDKLCVCTGSGPGFSTTWKCTTLS